MSFAMRRRLDRFWLMNHCKVWAAPLIKAARKPVARGCRYCRSPPSAMSFHRPCTVSSPASTAVRTNGKVIRFSRLTSNRLPFQFGQPVSFVRDVLHAVETGAQDVHPAADITRPVLQRRAHGRNTCPWQPLAPRRSPNGPCTIRCATRSAITPYSSAAEVPWCSPSGIMRWHKVGDIAVNEEFALIGSEDRGYVNAAVAAGNHHGARMLATPCARRRYQALFSRPTSSPSTRGSAARDRKAAGAHRSSSVPRTLCVAAPLRRSIALSNSSGFSPLPSTIS